MKNKILIQNPGVHYHYQIIESFETGIELKGFEVKSIKSGRGSLKGSYASIKNNEIFLINFNIPPYQPKNTPKDYDENRPRRLLLKKNQIKNLIGKLKEKKFILVPTKVYLRGNLIKIEISLAKPLKKYEKREKIKEREFKRIKERFLKGIKKI